MKKGPSSAKLSFDQITVLRRIQSRRREGIEKLAAYMKTPFRWQTLSQALRGRGIRLINYQFIVDWLLNEQKTEGGEGGSHSADSRASQVSAVRGRSE